MYQCNVYFLQTHLVNDLNFIPCSGIKDSADLEGSYISRKLFSVVVTLPFQLRMKPWSALLMVLLFACHMCYRMQAQGGTSSSMHLAGAASICFPKELICKGHESFHI